MTTTDLQLTFDYASLDAETRIVVQQRTDEIRSLVRKSASDIIEIGLKLIDVKKRLRHGQFLGWLALEFEWKERAAEQFMAVGRQFKSANFADLSVAPSALYLLASGTTPDQVRQELIAQAEAGKRITYSMARDAIAAFPEQEARIQQFKEERRFPEVPDAEARANAERLVSTPQRVAQPTSWLTPAREQVIGAIRILAETPLGQAEFLEGIPPNRVEFLNDNLDAAWGWLRDLRSEWRALEAE